MWNLSIVAAGVSSLASDFCYYMKVYPQNILRQVNMRLQGFRDVNVATHPDENGFPTKHELFVW